MFLSTTEPISEDGKTLNPTKSPCDRYVFNTVLTRAKSLVVVVGSPRILLSTEQHMVKLYGNKGRCWSLYLKSCLEHDTLIIPPSVEPDQTMTQRFKEQLAAQLGAIPPNNPEFRSSRPNNRTRDTNVTSNTQVVTRFKLATHSAQSSQHTAAQLKAGIHRPLSSEDKRISEVKHNIIAPMSTQITNTRYSQLTVHKQPVMGSVQAAPKSQGINKS